MECHGTGTKVGDPQEVNNIVDVFCKDRREPLLIGSTKSNMGHSEAASGMFYKSPCTWFVIMCLYGGGESLYL
jgi:3-oxoacyl-(acyl-carrier-protein) synthase